MSNNLKKNTASEQFMNWKLLALGKRFEERKLEGCSCARKRTVVFLTNRFHFAVRLYSDNAQMTSKRGENKEVRYEPQASSVTDVLTTF